MNTAPQWLIPSRNIYNKTKSVKHIPLRVKMKMFRSLFRIFALAQP